MRECYDRLLSVAAATANSAYGKQSFNFMNLQFCSFLHKFGSLMCCSFVTVVCMVILEYCWIELTSVDIVARLIVVVR